MKKLVIILVVLLSTFCLFADDALVLPEGVMRLTLADISAFGDKAYDSDGNEMDSSEVNFNKFGAAIEMGITDNLTAAIQWTPGVNLYGSIKDPMFASVQDQLVYNGIGDLFIGAKFQIVGTETLVQSEMMRFAAAAGIKIPLDSYDTKSELTALMAGDEFRIMSGSDNEALGLGARLYFDFIVMEDLFINLYSEMIYYLKDADSYAIKNALIASMAGPFALNKSDFEYGTWIKFELEPHYTIQLDGGSSIGIGIPAKLSIIPDQKVDSVVDENSGKMAYSIAPAVSFFNAKGFPFEVKAQYDLPLGGVNTLKNNLFIFQLKLFYDFY